MLYVAIMAGGLGKRMKSSLPKVLHRLNGVPMLVRVINEAIKLNPRRIYVIVGKYRDVIEDTLKEFFENIQDVGIRFVNQEVAKGTGHAIQCCRETLFKNEDPNGKLLILSGDVPLITGDTLKDMVDATDTSSVMTTSVDEPYGYGRVIVNKNIVKIVEHKDCTEDELKIKYVNCGIYVFHVKTLCDNIMKIDNNNAQNEYYLPDVLRHIGNMQVYKLPYSKQCEIANVNTKEELEKLEKSM